MKTMRYKNSMINMDSIEGVVVGEEFVKFFVKNNGGSYFLPIKEINISRELITSIIETKLNLGESFSLEAAFADQKRYEQEDKETLGDPETQEYCRKIGYTEWEQREMKVKTVGTTENPATSFDIGKEQKEIKIESELL